jgi:hypothetical protein
VPDLERNAENPRSRPATTPTEINEKNRRFWNRRNRRFHRLLRISSLAEEALEDLDHRFCFRCEPSLYDAIFRTAERRKRYRRLNWRMLISEFSKKGRKARKPDLLQEFIVATVKARPNMSCPDLLQLIKSKALMPPITEVTEEEVLFGTRQLAPLSGLKSRLQRARKTLGIKIRERQKKR